ncbi:hypothetical protein F4808DRAFT_431151 [Astrocystis sublimbata]|nr:hypothetical protein F4808DRAFT_431151 [Astrocystis sublimbata]
MTRRCISVPPSRSSEETLDWIYFTIQFVMAASLIDRKALARATEGQISFTEALGLEVASSYSMRAYEASWVQYGRDCGTPDHLPSQLRLIDCAAFPRCSMIIDHCVVFPLNLSHATRLVESTLKVLPWCEICIKFLGNNSIRI